MTVIPKQNDVIRGADRAETGYLAGFYTAAFNCISLAATAASDVAVVVAVAAVAAVAASEQIVVDTAAED